jgi:glycosyltransferase involved in cell wall biosynthesis
MSDSPAAEVDTSTTESEIPPDHTLRITYIDDTDDVPPEVSLDAVRNAIGDLTAMANITVCDAGERTLKHIADAQQYRENVFFLVPPERSTDIDTFADVFGLNILALPTVNPSRSTLTECLFTVISDHPNSQVIISPTAFLQGATSNETVTPATGVPTPYHDVETLVGIPAYNEEASIADIVADAAQHADEVLVVDDASSDNTAEEAVTAGATVVQHGENRGYGGSLNTIFDRAARRDPAHLIIIDGDGQHDPSDIPDSISAQQQTGADIVISSRFETGSETELPIYRRAGLAVVNTLTNLSMGVIRRDSWIRDTQSGFRTYNRHAIQSIDQDDMIGDGMSASTDILYHAHRHDYTIEEIGTTIEYDVEDPSSHSPITHGLTLVMNILRTIERDRPVTSLGIPGFVCSFVGLGLGYWTVSNYLSTGVFSIGLAVSSSFFGLLGVFACFTAIILHSLSTHHPGK